MKYIQIILALIIVISSSFACTTSDPTEPVTVHVSPERGSDYATLEEAVERVPPNSTLILDAIEYRLSAPLVISKSLTIQGAGVDATIITSSVGGYIIAFEGDGQWALSDLAIERTTQFASDIMFMHGGEIVLENCKLAGGAESEDESIRGMGLVLTNNAQAGIANCSFVRNDGAGIFVGYTASATMEQVTCSENGIGILFGANATGLLQDSTCADNKGAGVHLLGNARLNLTDNRLLNNGGPGVFARLDSSGGKIQSNSFSKNALGLGGMDIQIYGPPMPEVSGNSCSNESNRDHVWGGDLDGIVFMMFGHEAPQISVPANNCAIAVCTGMSLWSMSCK